MASSIVSKFVCATFVCMIMVASLADAAITCGTVTEDLGSCLPFLTGTELLSQTCCGGVRTLNSMASTTADRKAACDCLKSTAAQISNLNFNNAANLPSQCGVNIPYKISPTTDCTKVV